MYVIASYEEATGSPGNDSPSLRNYFELGWELMSTHLNVKDLLHSGKIDRTAVIVTCRGREFLYSALFDRVIFYAEWKSLAKVSEAEVLDLAQQYVDGCIPPEFFGSDNRYVHWERDLALIQTIDLADLNPSQDFACVAIRFRDHVNERNSPAEYFHSLIEQLHQRNLCVYFVGMGAEQFEGANSHQVTLQEWATLMQHPRCKCIVGTQTGTIAMAFLVANQKPLFVLDVNGSRPSNNHPIILGDCVNFAQCAMRHYHGVPTLEHLLQDIFPT